MLFRLIVLLAAGIFIALYFAPDRPGDETRRRTAAETPAPAAQLPAAEAPAAVEAGTRSGTAAEPALPPPPVAESDVAPAPAPTVDPAGASPGTAAEADLGTLPETPSPGTAPESAPETGAVAEDPFAAATDGAGTPVGAPMPDLGQLGAGGTADAVSLSDSVRTRTAPEAVPAPPTRPGLGTARTGTGAPEAPAQLPVGPVTGPRAQVVATSVNLRAGPNTGAAVLGRVSFGDVVVVVQPNAAPGWTGIRDPGTGQTAFISSQFLQVIP